MRIVIALGGNALGQTPTEQLILVKKTAKVVVNLIKQGHEIIIGHGNGPQVGIINTAMDFAYKNNAKTPKMPFSECGAMSQGYIGYHLQQAIFNELKLQAINRNCITIITQVIVDKNDLAFKNPTKPIGMFYNKEEAEKLSKIENALYLEDSNRGYRKVVASPIPLRIVELNIIKQLIKNDNIIITVGGGGIPVIEENNILKGVDAVIDKDKSSAKLASDIKADLLIILTSVDAVYLNYNTKKEIKLNTLNKEDAQKYISNNQFARGSMLPKIEACLDFIQNNQNKTAIICGLEDAEDALKGLKGTIIKNN